MVYLIEEIKNGRNETLAILVFIKANIILQIYREEHTKISFSTLGQGQ